MSSDIVVGFGSVGGPFRPVSLLAIALVAIILAIVWAILAASRFVQGGVVEHPERVPQLYGYTVCLVALLMGLASLKASVDSVLTLAEPTHAAGAPWMGWGEPSVTSFEAFRATYDRAREMTAGPNAPRPEPVAEDELRRRYEALRADRTARNTMSARRSLVTSGLWLFISLALFIVHWRWLARRARARQSAVESGA
ncbi:MAG: hypothetical protein ACR2L6_13015 [Gemmatimonadaceae bacterium]